MPTLPEYGDVPIEESRRSASHATCDMARVSQPVFFETKFLSTHFQWVVCGRIPFQNALMKIGYARVSTTIRALLCSSMR